MRKLGGKNGVITPDRGQQVSAIAQKLSAFLFIIGGGAPLIGK